MGSYLSWDGGISGAVLTFLKLFVELVDIVEVLFYSLSGGRNINQFIVIFVYLIQNCKWCKHVFVLSLGIRALLLWWCLLFKYSMISHGDICDHILPRF